jgi:hypothetical protein
VDVLALVNFAEGPVRSTLIDDQYHGIEGEQMGEPVDCEVGLASSRFPHHDRIPRRQTRVEWIKGDEAIAPRVERTHGPRGTSPW